MLPLPAVSFEEPPEVSSPATTSGGSGGSGNGGKLKRRHTNVEPVGAMASTCSGKHGISRAGSSGFLKVPPPMPAIVSKCSHDGDLWLPLARGDSDTTTPILRRQLTPRISWAALLSDAAEDALMCCESPVGRTTPRPTSRPATRTQGNAAREPATNFCPSPPPRPVASPCGRNAASSPPPRPEKLRSFALRAPPTPLGNRAASIENWEGGNRFNDDFEEARIIGSGSFAVVYRARNKIDKQEYAIKKTKKTLGRSARRQEMLQEALALASVAIDSPCPYIVRYFASWVEDERLFIQTELCDCSLKDSMLELRSSRPCDPRVEAGQLSLIIRDVCTGLAVMHAKNLVHLDVKPENILVKHVNRDGASVITHKIADLGLATAAMGSGCDEINEGDSRYLAREVLQGNFSDLTKADVFSLGLTCYELATNPKELPCNGEEWHRLRDEGLDECLASHLPPSMLALIRCMAHPVAGDRPPCEKVLEHEAISLLRPKELQLHSASDNPAPASASLVQELQSQLRQQTEAAEREQRRRASAEEKAARYWEELLHMKRQALIGSSDVTSQAASSPREHAPSPTASPPPPRKYRRTLTA